MISTNEEILAIQVGQSMKTKRGHTLIADWNERHQEINVQVYDNNHIIGYFAPKTYVSIYGGDIE